MSKLIAWLGSLVGGAAKSLLQLPLRRRCRRLCQPSSTGNATQGIPLALECLEDRHLPSSTIVATGMEYRLDAGIVQQRLTSPAPGPWTVTAYDVRSLHLAAGGNAVYALTRGDQVLRNDAAGGSLAWVVTLFSTKSLYVAGSGSNIVYALTVGGGLYRNNAATGVGWQAALLNVVSVQVTADGNVVHGLTSAGQLFRNDAAAASWSWLPALYNTRSVHKAGDYLYALADNGRLYRNDAAAGSWKWTLSLYSTDSIRVAATGQLLYARTGDGTLYRTSVTSTGDVWFVTLYGVQSVHTDGQDVLYALTKTQDLYQANLVNQGWGWALSAPRKITSVPLMTGTVTFSVGADGNLYHAEGGGSWTFSLYGFQSIRLVNDIVYAKKKDGAEFQAEVATGFSGWKAPLYHGPSITTAVDDGSWVRREHLDLIRQDPNQFGAIYNLYADRLKTHLGSQFDGLTQDGLILVFANIVAYELASYRAFGDPTPGPASLTLNDLLASSKYVCNEYCFLTVLLYRKAVPYVPGSPVLIDYVGFNGGAVGNHTQLFISGVGVPLLLDPTIGLTARTDLADLENQVPVAASRIRELTYRAEQGTLGPVLDRFRNAVRAALQNAGYRYTDRIFRLDLTQL